MSKKTKIGLLMGAVIIVFVAAGVIGVNIWSNNTTKSQTASVVTKSDPPTRAELLKLVNQVRAKNGVAPLKEDPRLDTSAQEKANDMVKYNYYSHSRNGVFIGQQFINATGITCPLDSENLDRENYPPYTAQAAVMGWVNSKPHLEAIINSKYTLTGFGISDNGKYLVEHFCEP